MQLNLKDKVLSPRWLLIETCVLIWVVLISLFLTVGSDAVWGFWNVPKQILPFLDFRLIPGTAQTLRMGIDPTVSNPGDPIGRLFNYPKVWYLVFYTGVSQDDTFWVVISLIVIFFLSAFAFPGKLKILDVLLLLGLLFSPAAMFLYARGNVDLAFFSLCALALLINDLSPYASLVLILIGAVFKIYPIFMLSVFLKQEKKRFWYLILAGLLIFGGYILLTFKDFQTDWNITQRGFDYSYGANVLVLHFRHEFNVFLLKTFSHTWTDRFLDYGPYVVAIFVFLAAVIPGVFFTVAPKAASQRNLDAFRVGAAIYICTFLMGNNWDYRLVFLLFTVPQILEWAAVKDVKMRTLSIITMVMIFAACWYLVLSLLITNIGLLDLLRNPLFLIGEVAKWGLFAGLTVLFFASAPEWLKPKFSLPFFSRQVK
jgi:hypothetical protein